MKRFFPRLALLTKAVSDEDNPPSRKKESLNGVKSYHFPHRQERERKESR